MKGVGNYRAVSATTTERRMAQLAVVTGPRASVVFVDGSMQTMPFEPLRKLGIVPGGRFFMVITYRGRNVVDVRVEVPADARPAAPPRPLPKVSVRVGMKTTTRR